MVLTQCVVVAVQNQAYGIDQGSIEVEERGGERWHCGEPSVTLPSCAGPNSSNPCSLASTLAHDGLPRRICLDTSSNLASGSSSIESSSISSPAVCPPDTKARTLSNPARRW